MTKSTLGKKEFPVKINWYITLEDIPSKYRKMISEKDMWEIARSISESVDDNDKIQEELLATMDIIIDEFLKEKFR